jgi:hypothetical protein
MEKMKPEEAMEMLREEGIIVTAEQARTLLEFLYLLASITVKQYLENEESRLIHSG